MVLDNDGNHVYFDRMDGQGYTNVVTAEMKARTALLTREPSKATMNRVSRDPNQEAYEVQLGFYPVAGGLPIVVDGQFLGAIGVGGMPASPPTWSDEICGYNALTAVLGFDKQIQYELVEENKELPPPPPDVDVLTDLALKQRPDLQALSYNEQAAHKFQRAQHDQLYPTISALGMAGITPVRPDCIDGCFPNYFVSSWYGGVGVNMSVPIFNGFLFTAESSEANYRACRPTRCRRTRNSIPWR